MDPITPLCVKFSDVSSLDLLQHHKPFLILDLNGKRSPAVRPQGLMASLHGPLDVLRIVIEASDDDEILQAAGDKELVGMDKPEVSRAQKGTFALIGKALPGRSAPNLRAGSNILVQRLALRSIFLRSYRACREFASPDRR